MAPATKRSHASGLARQAGGEIVVNPPVTSMWCSPYEEMCFICVLMVLGVNLTHANEDLVLTLSISYGFPS